MANAFVNADKVATAILGVLETQLVLPPLVWRMADADFVGAKGDKVTVRVPSTLTAREYEFRGDRSEPIVVDELAESRVDVPLDTALYSAVSLTDENLTLDVIDFASQVLDPQIRAVTRAMEQTVATVIENADYALEVSEEDPYRAAVKARAALNKAGVPLDERALVLGVDVETALLTSPLLVHVDQSGSDSALRNAQIGRFAGMPTFVSQHIDPATAYAFHRSAFTMANLAPAVPDGATFGESRTWEGYAVRWLQDYDPTYLRDRSVVSAFVGAASTNDGAQLGDEHEGKNIRAVKITGIGGAGEGDE